MNVQKKIRTWLDRFQSCLIVLIMDHPFLCSYIIFSLLTIPLNYRSFWYTVGFRLSACCIVLIFLFFHATAYLNVWFLLCRLKDRTAKFSVLVCSTAAGLSLLRSKSFKFLLISINIHLGRLRQNDLMCLSSDRIVSFILEWILVFPQFLVARLQSIHFNDIVIEPNTN